MISDSNGLVPSWRLHLPVISDWLQQGLFPPPAKPESLWLTLSFPPPPSLVSNAHTPFMHANWLSYSTRNTCKSLTHPTHSRGGSHEHMLHGPNRIPGSFTGRRAMLHQTGSVDTREARSLNQRAGFNPAESTLPYMRHTETMESLK